MTVMEAIGYLSSVLIGVSLGLIGGGGSILTVPVLVYLFSVDAVAATVYSLLIVGFTSAIGSIRYFRKGLVDLRTALLFGIPSIGSVLLTRRFLVPAIPQTLFHMGDFMLSKGTVTLLLFAVLMVAAAYNMIRKTPAACGKACPRASYTTILLQGGGVGLVTGLIGAGGGFLIIPALVMLLRLPMKTAVGTSLVIIAANSLIGFAASAAETSIDWQLMTGTVGAALAGIFIGMSLAGKVDGATLKPAFGWFILAMGFFILTKELFFH